MKRIAILGSTGSIGRSALSVVDAHPAKLAVVGLAAGANVRLFAEQVRRYRPRVVGMASRESAASLAKELGVDRVAGVGPDGLAAVATHPDVDIVLCASSGTAALEAVLGAIEAGKTIALANKEVLVMAGALMTEAARRKGVAILPVDSEHNAIHQCLHGRPHAEVRRLVLTASGGPFRGRPVAALHKVRPEDALKHPTWQMGRKITIDSATLMNKGLEVIEAHWLFDVPAPAIDVVIHPQSVVHSMVEFVDGSVIAQLGVPDMRGPISYALGYPGRLRKDIPGLDLVKVGTLSFNEPDTGRFPCLAYAFDAIRAGGTMPAVMNAANEVAVQAFLDERIGFMDIPETIRKTMDRHTPAAPVCVEDVMKADRWARHTAGKLLADKL